jgi:hypothetical protein
MPCTAYRWSVTDPLVTIFCRLIRATTTHANASKVGTATRAGCTDAVSSGAADKRLYVNKHTQEEKPWSPRDSHALPEMNTIAGTCFAATYHFHPNHRQPPASAAAQHDVLLTCYTHLQSVPATAATHGGNGNQRWATHSSKVGRNACISTAWQMSSSAAETIATLHAK